MDEHIAVSKKYPQIVLNTTYSFGIHDEDFMLAFEVDDIRDFQDLIMDLRETQVSTYVKNDIPMIVCVKKDIIPLITSLLKCRININDEISINQKEIKIEL
jgi:chlorite dismutase